MGSKLLYYLVVIPLSSLPFWALYGISDILYLVLYKMIGYRKSVVHQNLINSFPEKKAEEIDKIEQGFYAHLCDLVVESLKAFTITEKEATKRFKYKNSEIIESFFADGRSIVLVGGHYGNWELYAVTVCQHIPHKPLALFTPLKNAFFNEKITTSRSKFGLEMLPIQSIKKRMAEIDKEPTAVIFAADQSPRKSQRAYWMNFLNQDTGVQFGTEKFAKDYNLPVVFGNIHKLKRGYYEIHYSLITDSPKETAYGEITEAHTKLLESEIRRDPRFWLWSHKRWKHKRQDSNA